MMSTTTIPQDEWARRDRRKLSYHLLGTKNHLPSVDDEDDEDYYDEDPLFRYLTCSVKRKPRLFQAKCKFLRALGRAKEDVTDPFVQEALHELSDLYDPSVFDARKKPLPQENNSTAALYPGGVHNKEPPPLVVEGMWISLIKPKFLNSLGLNSKHENLYSLGRLSFGKFQPADLVCSLQGTFNPIQVVQPKERSRAIHNAPASLQQELRDNATVLRAYDVVTAFTIEPGSTSTKHIIQKAEQPTVANNDLVDRPIEGLLTTQGYMLPNPDYPNRLSIFFTSGSLEVVDQSNVPSWRRIFTEEARTIIHNNPPPPPTPEMLEETAVTPPQSRRRKSSSRAFLSSFLLPHRSKSKTNNNQQKHNSPSQFLHPTTTTIIPMEADGKMTYQLDHPVGGHDKAFVDILYLDDNLRILKGSHGDVHVEARVPNSDSSAHR